jgi:hypothetical protein
LTLNLLERLSLDRDELDELPDEEDDEEPPPKTAPPREGTWTVEGALALTVAGGAGGGSLGIVGSGTAGTGTVTPGTDGTGT